jgi:hypothetical protein
MSRFSKTLLSLAGVLALFTALAVPAALADSPHFISEGTASITSSGAYKVTNFKEAGLGTTVSTEAVTLSATATATYACINGGGNHPSAKNKETVTSPVSNTNSFPVRNGAVTGTLSVGPPGPGNFSCPSGQNLVLAFVSYTGVVLTGVAGDTSPEPDLSACLFPGVGIC